MNITNFLSNFWYGRITLWKSYWLIGELLNSIVIFIIYNIEINYFRNNLLLTNIPFLNFNNFHFLNKLFIISWTIFITVGIWRSAENYKGNIFWIILTFIIVAYRCFSLRLIFFI